MAWKPILCLDFDGVLHSYTTPWKNARTIADPPVPGAIAFILEAMAYFNVQILSSRSHQFLGRWAMKNWLRQHMLDFLWEKYGRGDSGLSDGFTNIDVEDDLRTFAFRKVAEIKFPKYKPPAHLTLDDRACRFVGIFPDPKTLTEFKPWNRSAKEA